MTAQGHPLTRLQRALTHGSLTLALATAAEIPKVPLPEALAICLLIRDKDPGRYERAAIRWHSRFCGEVRVTLTDANVAMSGLMAIGSKRPESGYQALIGLAEAYGQPALLAVLEQRLPA